MFANRRNTTFRKNALEVLFSFDKCMVENGYNYCLIFGTLLGAIREKGFITHDFDIDVAIPIKERTPDLQKKLEYNGFKLSHRFRIEDGDLGCEETYIHKKTGVSIDVFFICPAIDTYPYVCCWNYGNGCASYRETMKRYGGVVPRRIELPFDGNLERVKFESIHVNIPQNAHLISEFSYGPNYLIPDPNYVAPTEHRYIWNEKLALFEEFV